MRLLHAIALLGGAGAGLAAALWLVGRLDPAPMPRADAWGTEIRDRSGALLGLAPAPGGVWRFQTNPAEVSHLLTQLLVAVEDQRFGRDPGIDPPAILRAAAQWARSGHVVSGGSTLTMQVAKLLDPRPRSLPAKALEAARAVDLWSRLPPDRILGLWLSLAPFGGNLVGVEAASWAYFGKPPGELDAAASALLVALPRRPEALRPDRHPAAARRVRDRILRLAEQRGLLTPAETEAALAEPVPTARLPMPRVVPQLLAGIHHPPVFATTLDAGTQSALTALARGTLGRLPPHVALAVMIADLPSRHVRAVWAGDWGDGARAGSVDLTRALRSPGSALKPFLYGLAFSDGLAGPDTLLADGPENFGGYTPEDFTNRFAGRVTATEALQRSLNLPAVGLLARYGALRFAAALAAAGEPLRLPPGAEPSLPIILGGGGQTLRGLMALYAGLATDGRVVPVTLQPGPSNSGLPMLTPEAAQTIAAILTRPLPGGGPAEGIAWKTGTSWGDRDNWAMGFDRAHVVGVWVGRPDGTAMDGGSASDHALPVLAGVFGLLPPAPVASRETTTATLQPLSLRVAPDADPLRLLFPPQGAVIAGMGSLDLRAMGGARPLSFLVDGAPVPSLPPLRDTEWTPPGPGFYRVTVLDAGGAAVHAAIRVENQP
ncbi:transglycosylase domain-containing protein [Acidisoma sp.]|uniref:transglycosylase domain-containing protein n=1 Tax=Acidisoma sp. TaxID=1872115 RepID=UPI003AFF65C1